MPDDIFNEIDIDINHFDEIFPNLSLGDTSQYYDDVRFNDLFGVNGGRDLSVLHLNVRSMSRNGDCLITHLSLLDRKFDILCLSETFVNDVTIVENFLDGYRGFHSIRDGNQARGGVAIYVKNELTTTIVPSLTVNLDFIETVFIQIEKNNKKTSIGCCYRRPGCVRAINRTVLKPPGPVQYYFPMCVWVAEHGDPWKRFVFLSEPLDGCWIDRKG